MEEHRDHFIFYDFLQLFHFECRFLEHIHKFTDFHAGDRSEYVKLVVRQLRSRKLCLLGKVFAGGSVFAVGKKNGGTSTGPAFYHPSHPKAARR